MKTSFCTASGVLAAAIAVGNMTPATAQDAIITNQVKLKEKIQRERYRRQSTSDGHQLVSRGSDVRLVPLYVARVYR